jgi:aminopeptidase N
LRRLVVLASVVAVALATTTASAAPVEGGRSTPVEDSYYPAKGDPSIDTLHYRLDLHWDRKARVLRGVATIRLRAAQDDRAIRLDLSRRLHVTRVRVDGRRVGARHYGNHLAVRSPIRRGERRTVRVSYRGTPGPVAAPGSRLDAHRLGLQVVNHGQLRTMQEPFGAFTWYPVNDQPSDKALYDVRVSAPRGWVGVSNGRLAARRVVHGRTVTRWTNPAPMSSYLVTLAVGPYRRYHQSGPHGLPITYWVPRDRPGLLTWLRDTTPSGMRWLERRLGPYPFDRVGIVVVPGPSAMETQTLVTLGAQEYRAGRQRVRSVVVHELAHQWYGDTVTPRDWRDVWMNEGMATYQHSLWVSTQSKHPRRRWRSIVGLWHRWDLYYRHRYGPPGAYDRHEFGSTNVYYPVALMWEHLRVRLGDARFNRLVRAWPQTHRHTNADREDLIAWFETQSGEELSTFFDRWLNSIRTPT